MFSLVISSSWQKHSSRGRKEIEDIPSSHTHLWQRKSAGPAAAGLWFLQLLHDYYSFAVTGFPIGFLHPKKETQLMRWWSCLLPQLCGATCACGDPTDPLTGSYWALALSKCSSFSADNIQGALSPSSTRRLMKESTSPHLAQSKLSGKVTVAPAGVTEAGGRLSLSAPGLKSEPSTKWINMDTIIRPRLRKQKQGQV